MKDDQRIALTKRLLKEGLLRLLSEKELGKISVTELCKESGINRATFYRHYEQPKDILGDIRLEMFQDIQNISRKDSMEGRLDNWLEETCDYFYENAAVLNVLFKYRTDDEFVIFLNDLYKELFPELKSKGYFNELDEDTLRLGMYYFSGGVYYILRQWLTEPIHKTPKEVAQLIYHFLNIA